MSTKGKIILWSIVGVIALSVAGFFGVRNLIRKHKAAPLVAQMSTYLAAPVNGAPEVQVGPDGVPVPHQHPGPVRKRMVVIDRREREIDSVFWDLPEALRATTPEEVGTVVWLDHDKIQRLVYDTKPGWQHYVRVLVIDLARKEIVADAFFIGSMPPSSIDSRSSEGNGGKPNDEVVSFLANLPRL